MSKIINGYIERKNYPKRNWYIPKWANQYAGNINLGNVYIPKKYIGKKIRFKVEIVKE